MTMSNTEPPNADAAPATLSYPCPPPQTRAELVDVCPEVKWLRMPMPYALDHVNVYLLKVAAGWVIIDTGPDTSESRAIWDVVFSGPLRGETVVGVLCTHFHVDHVGLAGYLTERWRIPLLMSYEEFFSLRGWPRDLREVPWQHAEFFRSAGYPDELLSKTLLMFDFSAQISPLPPAFVRLQDGLPLPIGGGDWQIIIGRGHSPEQAILFSAERAVLISGDQLLPRISSNVSVSVVNPQDEPLSCWLASLDRLAELPEETLVLPGHGEPFCGVRTRVAELRNHHDRKLQFILDVCAARPLSVYEIVQMMYPLLLPDFDLLLAVGECLAHIRYLVAFGRLDGTLDGHGVIRYHPSSTPTPPGF